MPLHFTNSGHGEPIVLVHGLFGSLENLGAIARSLSERFSVYSIDLPNHGRSPHREATDLGLMVDDIRQWMLQQKLSKAHIVGHSLGGKAAMELALTSPALVNKLVVMDMAPVRYDPHHNKVFKGLLSLDLAGLKSRSDADKTMKHHVPESSVRSFLLKNLNRHPAGHFDWRMNLSVIHAGYPDLIRENVDKEFVGDTLFLKGGTSNYIQEQYRDAILSRFPNTQLKIIPNAGHWLHAEKPALVSNIIMRFLEGDA